MGKTSKWIKHLFLASNNNNKKKKDVTRGSTTTTENQPSTSLPTTPKEKRRWSFRQPAAGAPPEEEEQRRHAAAVLAATAAASEAAQAAAKAAQAVVRLTSETRRRRSGGVEDAAARKIQSVFRGYLARKALNALRGLVKLQALVRGHLVRKQAAATLRCMQALVTVQTRARMQRIKINDDYSLNQITNNIINDQRHLNYRKSVQDSRFRPSYNEMDRGMEENIKIVEMDYGDSKTSTKGRISYSNYSPTERTEHHRFSTQSAPNRAYVAKPDQRDVSPAPSAMSALTEIMSPRACSNHFEDYSLNTAQSSPQYYSAISKPHEYAECGPASFSYHDSPSYMANTESSRAKARSQSAPKSRPDNPSPQFERQPSKRRPSIEGRNVPRAVRMLRSSSHLGSAAQNYHYPWSVKLDKSNVSLKDSECGSTSTVLTNTQYCRSLVGFEVSGKRY